MIAISQKIVDLIIFSFRYIHFQYLLQGQLSFIAKCEEEIPLGRKKLTYVLVISKAEAGEKTEMWHSFT